MKGGGERVGGGSCQGIATIDSYLPRFVTTANSAYNHFLTRSHKN